MRPLLATTVLVLTGGCAHRVYSPPSRAVQLQSPANVGEGRLAVAGEVGSGGAMFGPRYVAGDLRLRYGATPTLEVDATASVVEIEAEDAAVDVHPFIYAARAGLKWTPAPVADFVALTAGVGGGGSAGGGFVAPDAGLVLGFENRYLVPFASLEGLLSLPVAPRAVDTSTVDDGPGVHVARPRTAYGARGTLGLRVPFTLGGDHPGSLYLAYSLLKLWDTDGHDEGFGGLAAAFEAAF